MKTKYPLVVLCCFMVLGSVAQQKTIPKITLSLGSYKGNEVPKNKFAQIVDSAIVAKDDKGITYTVYRFRSIYKFLSFYEDPQTGLAISRPDMRVLDFKNTDTMSVNWRESIKDNISKGDEMIIDDVVVLLKDGTKLMLPAMQFKVVD